MNFYGIVNPNFMRSTTKINFCSHSKTDIGTKTSSFIKIEEIVPAQNKTLADARGYAVADYQDYLEKRWIDDLRQAYPVQVNEDAFKTLVKK